MLWAIRKNEMMSFVEKWVAIRYHDKWNMQTYNYVESSGGQGKEKTWQQNGGCWERLTEGEVGPERVTEVTVITVYYIYDKCHSETLFVQLIDAKKKWNCLWLLILIEDGHREIKCIRPRYPRQTLFPNVRNTSANITREAWVQKLTERWQVLHWHLLSWRVEGHSGHLQSLAGFMWWLWLWQQLLWLHFLLGPCTWSHRGGLRLDRLFVCRILGHW